MLDQVAEAAEASAEAAEESAEAAEASAEAAEASAEAKYSFEAMAGRKVRLVYLIGLVVFVDLKYVQNHNLQYVDLLKNNYQGTWSQDFLPFFTNGLQESHQRST